NDSYYLWAGKVKDFLCKSADEYFGRSYTEGTGITQKLELYAGVLYGTEETLPWADKYLGLTFETQYNDGYGIFALTTINNNTLLRQDEGLTLTTLHELRHLIGLTHPHDYWDLQDKKIQYNWLWDYTISPMTYLTGGYLWDYFDRQEAYKIQIDSLIQALAKNGNYYSELNTLVQSIRSGSEQYPYGVLEGLTKLYSKTINETDRRNVFGVVTTGMGLIVIGMLLIKRYDFIRRKKSTKI
ncbi:MAG: hypothetical protein ACTSPV_05655, partial [Candidatus Hodarchaeales archaeon]